MSDNETDIAVARPMAYAEPVTEAGHRNRIGPILLLAGLIALAIALRFWRLGDWNFEATEIFTHRDSISRPRFTNPRPLIYFLNYYAVRPLVPLDEFGLRLLPAVFGVLAIPALYFVSRGLIGTRAALFGALLLTVSPLHVFYSQFARYWSLVFLLSALYPYVLYRGVRERNGRALALGLLFGALATLAHPVSVLLIGGPALWWVATALKPRHLTQVWQQRSARWAILLGLAVAAVVALRFIPILQSWIAQHDKAPGRGQFLMRAPGGQGLKQIFYLVNFAESLTLPLVLIAVVGLYLIWRERDRQLGLFLGWLAAFPVVFLTLLSLRTPVSTYYLLPTVPVFYLGAGVFLDRLCRVDWQRLPQWLLPATVATAVVSAGVPTLISDHLDGRRYDFRGIARWLQPRLTPEDVVFSDQPLVLAHYLPGVQVQRLREPDPLVRSFRQARQSGPGAALWIVLPAPSHAFRTNPKLGILTRWIFDHCQLRSTSGVGRIDFRQNYLQAYRCPAERPGEEGASSE